MGGTLTDLSGETGNDSFSDTGNVLRAIQLRAIHDTRVALREQGLPTVEANLLPSRLVRPGARRYIKIKPYLFRNGDRPQAEVETGLRFDLADKNRQPLYGFGVFSGLAIQAIREVNLSTEKLPIPAVAIKPGGEPSRYAELMLTISLVQVVEEPEPAPLMCFSLAHQDRTPLYSFGMNLRRAINAISFALERP